MAVTAFQDLPLADRDRHWDGAAAEKRVRAWAGAADEPNPKYRDAHVWYDADSKGNFTAYKLLIADVIDGRFTAVPRGVMAAAGVIQGARGGVDIPDSDVDRVRSHLAKYYTKMADTPPGLTEVTGGAVPEPRQTAGTTSMDGWVARLAKASGHSMGLQG